MLDALDCLIGLVSDGLDLNHAAGIVCREMSVSRKPLLAMFADVAPIYGLAA